jgi:hypothetical protein
LPLELLNFRNVRGQPDLEKIVVEETFLKARQEWDVEVERISASLGRVVVGDKVYNY